MLAKRIIPCLDINKGRVVKGVNFLNLIDAGDPVELAKFYNKEGADELVFLDITATSEKRKTVVEIVKKVAEQVFIPFTVGGGISTIDEIRKILRAGADKVSLNSAAVKNPELIKEAAKEFGNQCIVLAVDTKKVAGHYEVFVSGGKVSTGVDTLKWIKKAVALGAGEILLTSMDQDGTKAGFDLKLTQLVSEAVNVPVIASGGAGQIKDFKDVFTRGKADAALAASLFHFGELKISDIKKSLLKSKIAVRN